VLVSVVLTYLCGNCLQAQDLYRITFTDKGSNEFFIGSEEYTRVVSELHPNSIARRALAEMNPIVVEDDRPIFRPYLDGLDSLGVAWRLPLRWRNCVVAEISNDLLAKCRKLPYVKHVQLVSELSYSSVTHPCNHPGYGSSATPIEYLGVQELHNAGVYGRGVRVCVIDNGFDLRRM
jgi:hypothetical protein